MHYFFSHKKNTPFIKYSLNSLQLWGILLLKRVKIVWKLIPKKLWVLQTFSIPIHESREREREKKKLFKFKETHFYYGGRKTACTLLSREPKFSIRKIETLQRQTLGTGNWIRPGLSHKFALVSNKYSAPFFHFVTSLCGIFLPYARFLVITQIREWDCLDMDSPNSKWTYRSKIAGYEILSNLLPEKYWKTTEIPAFFQKSIFPRLHTRA